MAKKRDEEQEESAVVPSQLSVSGSVSVLLKTGGSGYIPHSCRSSAIIEELGRKVSLGLIRFMRAEGASEWRSTKVRGEVLCQEHEKGLLTSRVGLVTLLSCELSLYAYILNSCNKKWYCATRRVDKNRLAVNNYSGFYMGESTAVTLYTFEMKD